MDRSVCLVVQRQAGGTLTYPSTRDEQGNEKWIIQDATVASNPEHILKYPKDLDAEIRQGMEIPDGAISNDGAGSWEGKSLPLAAFYSGLDSWVVQILCDIRRTLDPIARMNFGTDVEYEITHKPLAQSAMELQGQKQAGTDQGQAMHGDPSGMMNPADQGMQQRMGTLDPVDAVGRGVLSASSIVDAARRALDSSGASPVRMGWVPFEGERGGNGWKNSETGEVRYQDKAPTGPNSRVDTQDQSQNSKEFRISDEAIDSHPPVAISIPSGRFNGDVSKAREWAKKSGW